LIDSNTKKQVDFLNRILDSLSHPLCVINAEDYTVKKYNRTASASDLPPGTTCYELMCSRDKPCDNKNHICPLEEVKKTKKTVVVEHIHYDKDGNTRNIEVHAYPVLNDSGDVLEMIEYSLDITEQRRVEQVQRQQEEELRIIFDSVPALIFFKDTNNRLLRVNKCFADITGLPKNQIEGKSVVDLFPEHAERSWQDDLEVIESGVPIRNILESVVVGDNTVWLQTDKIPYRDSSGNIVGIIGFSQDITKRKRSEETLWQKSLELEERVKELNCLYTVSQMKMTPNLSINQVIQGVANIIPPSWRYPEITCARIVWGDKTYTSDNFVESKWGQSADIVVSGEIEGKVEVYYTKEMPEVAEGPLETEERSLIGAVAEAIGLYLMRKRIEIDLYASNLQLIAESKAQQESNTTLKGVLARIETEKRDNLLSVQSHVDRVVMPLLRQLKNGASDIQSNCISLIEDSLASVTSPFVSKLESRYTRLSPREVEISKHVKNGLSSKDISALLHTSEGTVRNQRKSIRRKLGISSDKVSLASFLRAI